MVSPTPQLGHRADPADAGPQRLDALRGGMFYAARAAERLPPAILLDIPKGMTVEAPQWLLVESPDRKFTRSQG